MIYIKDKKAIEKMRKAGRLLAEVVASVPEIITAGVNTLEIDLFIEKAIQSAGLRPECKGYRGYKHTTCISINDVVVHGVPSTDVVLKDGDLVKIDIVASYKGYCADMARCFFVGKPTTRTLRIVRLAQNALDSAILQAIVGNHVSDISGCVEKIVTDAGYDIVRDFAGHGIGKKIHEDPEVPNFKTGGKGAPLRAGMTLAIEPMIAEKSGAVYVDKDGWTVRTVDGGLAGHMEDTVLVTEKGPEVLTRLDKEGMA